MQSGAGRAGSLRFFDAGVLLRDRTERRAASVQAL